MRLSTVSTALAAIWSLVPGPASAAVLQPIEQWNLDYGATQCTAARSFGSASAPVTFGVVPSLSGGTYKVLVSVPRKGPAYARETLGSLDFGRGAISSPVLYYGHPGVQMSIYQMRVPAATMEQARSAPSVTVRSASGANFTFALSDMPALLDGLRACTASLQRYWNMGGLPPGSVAEAPLTDIGSLFTSADYPTEALRRQRQSSAQYQLLVDEKGTVAGCDVLVPSGVPAIDATGCELIQQRARFKPARDNRGQLVRSVWTTPLLAWTANGPGALDSGCTMQSSDMRTLLNTCDQQFRQPNQLVPPPTLPPPPPPPPPPKR